MSYGSFLSGSGSGPPKYSFVDRAASSSLLEAEEGSPALPASPASSRLPADLSIPRQRLLQVLSKRAERSANCRKAPLALLTYIITCYLCCLHGHVLSSYSMGAALQEAAVAFSDEPGSSGFLEDVADGNSWVDYFAGAGTSSSTAAAPVTSTGWVQSVLADFADGKRLTRLNRGFVRGFNLLIGGVRLSQQRRAVVPCTLNAVRSVFGECHSGASAAPFGDPDVYNSVTFASGETVAPAFQQSAYGSSSSFQLWLNVEDLAADNQKKLWVMDRAGWVDASTASLSVELSLLNGELGYVGRVALQSDFSSGGAVFNSAQVTVLPLDAYSLYPQLEVLDVFAVLYWVYMLLTCGARLVKAVRKERSMSRAQQLPVHLLTGVTWWHALDICAVVAFLVAIVQYSLLTTALLNLGLDPQGSPKTYAWGPNQVGLNIASAALAFAQFRRTLVWVLFFLTVRLFYYTTFQPRLAVLVQSMSRSAVELLHYGIVFSVILAFFGVWGHFMFGANAVEWSTPLKSMTTVLRFVQYDYDLDSMYRVSHWPPPPTHTRTLPAAVLSPALGPSHSLLVLCSPPPPLLSLLPSPLFLHRLMWATQTSSLSWCCTLSPASPCGCWQASCWTPSVQCSWRMQAAPVCCRRPGSCWPGAAACCCAQPQPGASWQ
jgi:hypothetical protein